MIKLLELFGGIGACSAALDRLGVEYEIADYVEIDKYAVASYNAIHNTDFKPQDITKWDKDIKVDLIMHGSPCQDFSVAGLGRGGDEGSGTRSSLMYETIRIVKKLRPKYVIWENVKGLLSKKHIHNFSSYIATMEHLGYRSYYQVLNSKNYGIPQNRERIFTVSILDGGSFAFPDPFGLKLRLKDVLEEDIDEKYYLSDAMLNCFLADGTEGFPRRERFLANINRKNQDIANTLSTRPYDRPTDTFIPVNVEPICLNSKGGRGGVDSIQPSVQDRVYDSEGISTAVTTSFMPKVFVHGDVIESGYIEKGTGKHQSNAVYDDKGISMTLCADDYKMPMLIKTNNKKGYEEAFEGDSINLQRPNSKTRRGKVGHSVAQTLDTQCSQAVVEPLAFDEQNQYIRQDGCVGTLTTDGSSPKHNNRVIEGVRIRKLTPLECWRLQGFPDEYFYKAQEVNSNTQLYKQAGNSITVDVLYYILKNLLTEQPEFKGQMSIEDFL